jgi:molybdenum cofactor cytidylyltransferase
MIFDKFDSRDAAGVVLAHSINMNACKVKKGRLLGDKDVQALKIARVEYVWGARLQAGDVGENEAAQELARLMTGENTRARQAVAGRSDICATVSGLALVDPSAIEHLNSIDESITVATLLPYSYVRSGDVVATIKIIPFAIEKPVLDRARRTASALSPLSVAGFVQYRVALITSQVPGEGERLSQQSVTSVQHRLEMMGNRLALVLKEEHDESSIKAALRQALAAGSNLILISGATATQDRKDIVPRAIESIGGVIDHFGMPVDPGNLTLLAHIGDVPVIIFPGCARLLRPNGFDKVLQRTLAGFKVTGRDIQCMGVGGLIDEHASDRVSQIVLPSSPECPKRPEPRLAALILAAGQSSRMGENKLLIDFDGIPLLSRVVNAALESRVDPVVVVTGNDSDRIERLLSGRKVLFVHNSNYEQGLSSSLQKGLEALPEDIDGAMILLGDMPLISTKHIDAIIGQFDRMFPRILVPEWEGRCGNPVVWPRRFFPEMRKLTGDQGARNLLREFSSCVEKIRFDDEAVLVDVDTPDDLSQLRSL